MISFRTLREFAVRHPQALEPLKAWYKIATKSTWNDITEIRATYPHADAAGKCTVFNIGGDDFRLVTRIDFESRMIFTKKVMTHAKYTLGNGTRWKKACGC